MRYHGPEEEVMPGAYTEAVDEWKNPNEDERGVDVGQIRDLLRSGRMRWCE